MTPKATKDPHYLKNSELLAEIILSKAQDRLTKKAENMLILLANRLIKKMSYYNPMDREDVLQGAILRVLTNWRSFNPEKSTNSFSYFSEVLKRGMAKSWGELKKIKGADYHQVKTVSLSSSNDGEGIFNL